MKIFPEQILAFYDTVQLFTGRNDIGGKYISLLIENQPLADKYIMFGVSPEKLRMFKIGSIDLRTLILERPIREWYYVEAPSISDAVLEATQGVGEIPENLLPGDYIMDNAPLEGSDILLERSVAHNTAVLEVWVDPPEAMLTPKIKASSLAGLITNVQSFVKYAYKKAISLLSRSARADLDIESAYTLEAVATAGGSFKIQFESTGQLDLFNHTDIKRALKKIDEITSETDSPQNALEILKNNKGHLAGSYIKLLDFLQENNTAFSYRWVSPDEKVVNQRYISFPKIYPLLQAFKESRQIGVEVVELHGHLRQVDLDKKTWRLELVEENESVTGTIKEGIGISLTGLPTGQQYVFKCEEEVLENPGTGRETRVYKLLEFNSE